MRALLLCILALCACAGADDAIPEDTAPPTEVVPCNPPPLGFIAWRDGEQVMVSKKVDASASGGVTLRAEIHAVPADGLPAEVDFGAEQIEVRPDMSLCLVSG